MCRWLLPTRNLQQLQPTHMRTLLIIICFSDRARERTSGTGVIAAVGAASGAVCPFAFIGRVEFTG